MKYLIALAVALPISFSTAALAQSVPDPELLCLDELEVHRIVPIAEEVLPRARIEAEQVTNCLVVIGRPSSVQKLRGLLARMEERARTRRLRLEAARPPSEPRRVDRRDSSRGFAEPS
ncbi:MAG: hypothetical protein AAGF12_04830 [Myxococcota bacterium]